MGYRDDAEAMRVRIETLGNDLSVAERRADEAETELGELRHAILRLRAGIRDEEALRTDKHLLVSEALLPVATVLGTLLTVAAVVMSPYEFHGHLQLDLAGVVGFVRQLGRGGLLTVALIVSAAPFAVLPSIASVGMHMRRRFGWYAAMAAWALWSVACPPLGIYGLYALGRGKVRDLFFVEAMPTPRVRVEETADAESLPSTDELVRRSQAERLARRRKAS